jgi:hypothetical protein
MFIITAAVSLLLCALIVWLSIKSVVQSYPAQIAMYDGPALQAIFEVGDGFVKIWWTDAYGSAHRRVPLGLAVSALLILPTYLSVRFIFAHREPDRSPRCASCGYNLTGNASGVCPECGAACKAANPAGVSPAAGD